MMMVTVKIDCWMCHKTQTVEVTADQFLELGRPNRRHVQDILPDKPRDVRELFISQTCGPCFDKLFAEPEE